MTRIAILEIETVNSLREDTSTCGFSCSTRSMKEVGMSDSVVSEAISEDSTDAILSDNRIPILGTILGVE